MAAGMHQQLTAAAAQPATGPERLRSRVRGTRLPALEVAHSAARDPQPSAAADQPAPQE
jgi:hypothetical protein